MRRQMQVWFQYSGSTSTLSRADVVDICKRMVLKIVLAWREQSPARRHVISICMLQCSPLSSSLPIRCNPRTSTSVRGERWRPIGRRSVRIRCNAPKHEGKQILMEVANGASVSKFKDLQRNAIAFLDKLSTESRELRWLACSQLPDFYKQKNNQRSRVGLKRLPSLYGGQWRKTSSWSIFSTRFAL